MTEKPENWPEDGEEFVPVELPSTELGTYFTQITTSDALQKDNLRYIGVLFTAKYCPPCERLTEPLKAFYDEFSQNE
mgnify:CR=1 FL=1|tara:strand:+ start:150 stop:380 length:231 start_codon:yes stop_codon:yes gene_type:complete